MESVPPFNRILKIPLNYPLLFRYRNGSIGWTVTAKSLEDDVKCQVAIVGYHFYHFLYMLPSGNLTHFNKILKIAHL